MIKAIITEKSTENAKKGIYTFEVAKNLTKDQIKKLISDIFKVEVIRVRTVNMRKRVRKNYMGRKIAVPARKKAAVVLKEGDKIDIFETKKSKKK